MANGMSLSAGAIQAGHKMSADAAAPIDRSYLARFTLGNVALEREVLGLFAEHAPTYLLHLMAADTERAWYEAAHTLKGSARAVGAWRVAAEAELAERLKDTPQATERTQRIDALAAALEEARSYIASLSETA